MYKQVCGFYLKKQALAYFFVCIDCTRLIRYTFSASKHFLEFVVSKVPLSFFPSLRFFAAPSLAQQ